MHSSLVAAELGGRHVLRSAFQRKFYGPLKQWTVVNEGVEFAILAAGIHAGRQLRNEAFVERPSAELIAKVTRVHAHNDGLKAQGYRLARKLQPIAMPQRKAMIETRMEIRAGPGPLSAPNAAMMVKLRANGMP